MLRQLQGELLFFLPRRQKDLGTELGDHAARHYSKLRDGRNSRRTFLSLSAQQLWSLWMSGSFFQHLGTQNLASESKEGLMQRAATIELYRFHSKKRTTPQWNLLTSWQQGCSVNATNVCVYVRECMRMRLLATNGHCCHWRFMKCVTEECMDGVNIRCIVFRLPKPWLVVDNQGTWWTEKTTWQPEI